MSETARSAEYGTDYQDGEIVKVRVQSTPEEITGFHQFLDRGKDVHKNVGAEHSQRQQ